ncbi:VWA domain-containing protein [Pseudomonadota bacterium]|nr:VWA domain-containing protein [Pseudomonadota bacterium]
MKLERTANQSNGMAFLAVITCGFGSIILLLIISKSVPPTIEEDPNDKRIQEISLLQDQLFNNQNLLKQQLIKKENQLREITRLEKKLAVLNKNIEVNTQSYLKAKKSRDEELKLKLALQNISSEMKRLYRKKRVSNKGVIAGIPIDSEYIIFIIDTSGSMFRYAWPKVIKQIEDTLVVYPSVKGVQILNDMGSYMFSDYQDRWIPDTPELRKKIVEKLANWNEFSNSSPAEGITTAIEAFYEPNRRISLYVYGDEFTGKSIREVVDYVTKINRKNKNREPLVRIHAIGFPVMRAQPTDFQHTGIKFASLMRKLCKLNGGTFVGLNSFR